MAEENIPEEIIKRISPFYKARKGQPSAEYKISYNSSTETLEPVYFWILDFMKSGPFAAFTEVDKLIDNFTASPGSGHFAELGQRATIMQQQATKILGDVNNVVKSILNLIYDLKEFQLRLKQYEEADSKDPFTAEAGLRGLKQIWMDQVDIKKGRGSVNMLAQDLNFVTIRDAFMAIKSPEEASKMDLNERVKGILKSRILEFIDWKERSYQELKKRYNIEKSYLRAQVDTVKLYSKWAKPYLVAAAKLKMNETSKYKPELVNVFETLYLQLTLFGKNAMKIYDAAIRKEIPPAFKDLKLKRDYYSCVLVNLTFRGIPQRAGQQYTFGGKVDVNFKAYALNKQELDLLYYNLDKSDFEDSLKLVEGMTQESLGNLKDEVDAFLNEDKPKKEEQVENTNPFLALLGMTGKKKEKPKNSEETAAQEKRKEEEKFKALEKKGIKKDNYAERIIRAVQEASAKKTAFIIYDVYKKAHGMASVPFGDSIQPEGISIFSDLFEK